MPTNRMKSLRARIVRLLAAPARHLELYRSGRLALLALIPLVASACAGFPEGGGNRGDDSELAQAVATALDANPITRPLSIEVSSLGEGRVRLLGFVDTETQKHTAEQVASEVEGVAFVFNTLYLN